MTDAIKGTPKIHAGTIAAVTEGLARIEYAARQAGFDRIVSDCLINRDKVRFHVLCADTFNYNSARYDYNVSDLVFNAYDIVADDQDLETVIGKHLLDLSRMPSLKTRELSHLAWHLKNIGASADAYSPAVQAVFQEAWNDAMEKSGLLALMPPSAPDTAA